MGLNSSKVKLGDKSGDGNIRFEAECKLISSNGYRNEKIQLVYLPEENGCVLQNVTNSATAQQYKFNVQQCNTERNSISFTDEDGCVYNFEFYDARLNLHFCTLLNFYKKSCGTLEKDTELFDALTDLYHFNIDDCQIHSSGFLMIQYIKKTDLIHVFHLNKENQCKLNYPIMKTLQIERISNSNVCSWDCLDYSENKEGLVLTVSAHFYNQRQWYERKRDPEIAEIFQFYMEEAAFQNGIRTEKTIEASRNFIKEFYGENEFKEFVNIEVNAVYPNEMENNDEEFVQSNEKFLIAIETNAYEFRQQKGNFERSWSEFLQLYNAIKSEKGDTLPLPSEDCFEARREIMEKCLKMWGQVGGTQRGNSLLYLFLSKEEFDIEYRDSKKEFNRCLEMAKNFFTCSEQSERWVTFHRDKNDEERLDGFLDDILFEKIPYKEQDENYKEMLDNQKKIKEKISKAIWNKKLNKGYKVQVQVVMLIAKFYHNSRLIPLKILHVRPEKDNDYFVDAIFEHGCIFKSIEQMLNDFRFPCEESFQIIHRIFRNEEVLIGKNKLSRFEKTKENGIYKKHSLAFERWLDDDSSTNNPIKHICWLIIGKSEQSWGRLLIKHRGKIMFGLRVLGLIPLMATILPASFTVTISSLFLRSRALSAAASIIYNINWATRLPTSAFYLYQNLSNIQHNYAHYQPINKMDVACLATSAISFVIDATHFAPNFVPMVQAAKSYEITKTMRNMYNVAELAHITNATLPWLNANIIRPLQYGENPAVFEAFKNLLPDIYNVYKGKNGISRFDLVSKCLDDITTILSTCMLVMRYKQFKFANKQILHMQNETISYHKQNLEKKTEITIEYWENDEQISTISEETATEKIKMELKRLCVECKDDSLKEMAKKLIEFIESDGMENGQNRMIQDWLDFEQNPEIFVNKRLMEQLKGACTNVIAMEEQYFIELGRKQIELMEAHKYDLPYTQINEDTKLKKACEMYNDVISGGLEAEGKAVVESSQKAQIQIREQAGDDEAAHAGGLVSLVDHLVKLPSNPDLLLNKTDNERVVMAQDIIIGGSREGILSNNNLSSYERTRYGNVFDKLEKNYINIHGELVGKSAMVQTIQQMMENQDAAKFFTIYGDNILSENNSKRPDYMDEYDCGMNHAYNMNYKTLHFNDTKAYGNTYYKFSWEYDYVDDGTPNTFNIRDHIKVPGRIFGKLWPNEKKQNCDMTYCHFDFIKCEYGIDKLH